MKTHFSKSGGYKTGLCLFTLIGLLGILLLWSSCKKDEENTNEMDEESVYNIALQEEYAGVFNSLLFSLDTITAADSTLNMLLNDQHVIDGTVVEQAIFIDYRDGTRGGIFFDPQDYPDEEFSYHNQLISSHGKKILNNTPTSKRTIMINPHYFEREKFTNFILNEYDKLFPDIGYETPERYFNYECDLELFTKLEGYGFIHIYSHGIRLDNKVYLKTGERPNGRSHYLYRQMRSEKKLVCMTRIKDKTTHYHILPDFIKEYNSFNNDKPLVFGGFCYSYLGGWPEMFKNASTGGYFGYDWAVRTVMHKYWTTDIISYLTDFSVDEPYSTSWWMNSSPMEKDYWDAIDSKWVNIKYKGSDDLVLWDWEGLDFDFTSFNLTLKVNARIESSDGSSTYELWTLPYSLGHSINFSGNKFSNSWDYEPYQTGFRSGEIEIMVSPGGKEIIDFKLNDTIYFSGMNTVIKNIYNIRLDGLPLVLEDGAKAVFEKRVPMSAVLYKVWNIEQISKILLNLTPGKC